MRTTKILAALFIAAAAATAHAQDKGPYIGASFGFTRADTGNDAQEAANELVAAGFASANVKIDESSNGFKVFGGYRLNRNFALEGYYADLGKFDIDVGTTGPSASLSGDVKLTGFGADAVGILPLGQHNAFAKLGFIAWDSKAKLSGSGVSVDSDDDGTDVKFGAGVDWRLTGNLALRTELEYYSFDDPVTMLSAGLLYRF